MMSPYYADPYYVEPLEWDVAPSLRSMMRPMRRMERQMDREVGKLLSSVKEDDKSFQVMVDVSQFRPNEVTVRTTDKNVIVHGKHEERTDKHGFVSREFRRRISLPKGVNPEQVTSTLSPEGTLTVMAPKMAIEGSNERVIPITMAPTAGTTAATVGSAPTVDSAVAA